MLRWGAGRVASGGISAGRNATGSSAILISHSFTVLEVSDALASKPECFRNCRLVMETLVPCEKMPVPLLGRCATCIRVP